MYHAHSKYIMKKLLILLPFLFLVPFAQVHAITCGDTIGGTNGYSFAREICIDHTKAGASNTSNFVMDYSETDSWLKTVANGGLVQNTATQTGGGVSITVPADVIFTSDSSCTTKLNWEFETYNSSTGNADIWVNLGTLSHTSDTHIWECYDNSSVTTWQGNVNATWDSNYKLVSHLANGTSLSGVNSTTGGIGNGTVNSATAGIGQIDGGANFLASNSADIDYGTPNLKPYTAFTASIWMKDSALAGTIFTQWDNAGAFETFILDDLGGSGHLRTYVDLGTNYTVNGTTNVADGKWHLIEMVWSSGDNTLRDYVDGSQQSSIATAGGNFGFTGGHLYIGAFDNGAFFTGSADEARISNVARSADQILAEYNNQSATSTFYTVGSQQFVKLPTVQYNTFNFSKGFRFIFSKGFQFIFK
jgi:hypothetical protein